MTETGTARTIPRVWQYESGRWVQVPDPLASEPVEDGLERLSAAGFIPAGEWFGPHPAVSVFERQTGDGCEWRIELAITDSGRHVISVRRLPDFLDVLAKLAIIATADEHGQNIAHGVQVSYPFSAPD